MQLAGDVVHARCARVRRALFVRSASLGRAYCVRRACVVRWSARAPLGLSRWGERVDAVDLGPDHARLADAQPDFTASGAAQTSEDGVHRWARLAAGAPHSTNGARQRGEGERAREAMDREKAAGI
eukprot:3214047-Pleurochrysis_carterae.AAC.2